MGGSGTNSGDVLWALNGRFEAVGFLGGHDTLDPDAPALSVECCRGLMPCLIVRSWLMALVDGSCSLPMDLVLSCKHLVLHADLCETQWLNVAGLWGAEIVPLSPRVSHGVLLDMLTACLPRMAVPLRKLLERGNS